MNGVGARFPFYLPMRCPIDNGPVEMLDAITVQCEACGANGIKMARELERLRALGRPEEGDIEKAARALHHRSSSFHTSYDKLPASTRNAFIADVKVVIRTLKKGLTV